ncbi:MAG TPA: hypothetical protein VHB79_08270 [Polyangiaceae bacterium]|nr:hypothetical protein [Polyangiaceae bacterium]
MRARLRFGLVGGAALAALWCKPARAAESDSAHPRVQLPGYDGVYGRFDGRLALAASAGAELQSGATRGSLRVSAHYWWTAGVYARFADAFGGADAGHAERVASFGIDLRPLFLPRFARNYEQGPPLLDLTLDSLSLTAGGYFAQPHARSLGDERGFELGCGLGVPLFAAARGLWLEGRAEHRFADVGPNAWVFTAALAFHGITWTAEPPRR